MSGQAAAVDPVNAQPESQCTCDNCPDGCTCDGCVCEDCTCETCAHSA
ncbi:hypothetical protein ACXR8F_11670 [Terrabacter sp. AAH1]|jgi:hypothetical protein